MRPPSAVLFDIGDTLLEERRFSLEDGISAVVASGADVVGLSDQFRADVTKSHQRNGELLLAQWIHERVPGLASVAVADVEDRIWRAVVSLVPRAGVANALDRLRADDVPLAAVSNAAFSGRVLRAELARYGLAEQLCFVVSSADVGSRKPGATLFETAVRRLGVAASETWFVGDTLAEDVVGALGAGLQPVWLSHGDLAITPPSDVPLVRSWSDFLTLYRTSVESPGAKA